MIWLGLIALGAAAWVVTVKLQPWTVSARTLEQRYRRPNSRFLDIEGTRVHLLEEGPAKGPVIIALSAHWGSFATWDDWAVELTDKYKVIRVDLPGHGLTGRIPSNDYSIASYLRLLKVIIESLELEKFALVGTSFSGIIAYQYAALCGDRLTALILTNSSGFPRDTKAGPQPNQAPPHLLYRLMQKYYRPYGFFKWKLNELVVNKRRLTAEKIRTYTDMNNRTGRIAEERARLSRYTAIDPKPSLEKVSVPTLIQWSTQSLYLDVTQADKFCDYLTNTHPQKIIYANTGHLIIEDAPQQLARDTKRFLDDILTTDRTARVSNGSP